MKARRLWFLFVPTAVSCLTSGTGPDAWSRTYFASREDVIEAVIEVLEDEEYLVDIDRENGRIVAEPPRSAGNLAVLAVTVRRTGDRILVDVQTRSEVGYSTAVPRPAETAILEFLHQLDLRMQGLSG